jgi:3-oxoacyl-[acyl-carrier protein] reductase
MQGAYARRNEHDALIVIYWEVFLVSAATEDHKVSQSKRLKDKVALVTGSSRGIGAAIAMRLAADGANVAINYANNRDAADEVVQKISDLGAKASAFKANVTSEADIRQLIEQVIKTFGKLDILVNNAGVIERKPISQIDMAHYERIFNTNVKGVVATTITALPHIAAGGRIISISSGLAKASMPTVSMYSATKSAIETMTRVWAQELGKKRITVNAVAPGTTATDLLLNDLPEDRKQHLISSTALGRLGEPKDIAEVVAFLASDEAGWITGQTINCDGGLRIT